jgi:hypothetical protein
VNLGEAHTLTVRGDYRRNAQDAQRVSPFGVPTTGGDGTTSGGGVLASLASRFGGDVFGGALLNEAKVYATRQRNAALPYVAIPGGRVRVSSALADGTVGLSSLSYGANPSLPTEGTTAYVEATEELSWLSGGGAHRVKLGGLLNASRYDQLTALNPFGTYAYNSLADFVEARPATFTRVLDPRQNDGGAVNAAVYLGDTWRRSRSFQLTYGVRLEGSTYSGAPARNADVEQAFGLRTDRFPSELRASPRVGFTYTHFPDTRRARRRRRAPGPARRRGGAPALFRGGPRSSCAAGSASSAGARPRRCSAPRSRARASPATSGSSCASARRCPSSTTARCSPTARRPSRRSARPSPACRPSCATRRRA